jgi:hypothetical protein
MPEQQSLRIEGLDELMKMLDRFPQKVQRAMTAGIHQSTAIVRKALATYPPRRAGVKVIFSSDRQRKGFFAKLRSGEIEVPYRRGVSPGSEKLGAGWTTEVKTVRSTHIKGIVGNRASYGPLVQGEQQTAMHKGTGWKTVEWVLATKKAEIERKLADLVGAVLGVLTRR